MDLPHICQRAGALSSSNAYGGIVEYPRLSPRKSYEIIIFVYLSKLKLQQSPRDLSWRNVWSRADWDDNEISGISLLYVVEANRYHDFLASKNQMG